MFFPTERAALRGMMIDAWRKFRSQAPLEPLEKQLAQLIEEHPEYHALLVAADARDRDWSPEMGQTNPFLHLAMHMTIREQTVTDRPAGIHTAWQRLSLRLGSTHEAEHRIMEVLGEVLWDAQRAQRLPDEREYLEAVQRLAGDSRRGLRTH